MIKKIICIILLCLCLVACGNVNQADHIVSDNVYEYGIAYLDIVDDYLDSKITIFEASEKIKNLPELETYITLTGDVSDKEKNDASTSILFKTMNSYVSSISSIEKILEIGSDKYSYTDIEEIRNQLVNSRNELETYLK